MGRPLSEKAHCTSPTDGTPGCRGQATRPDFALAGRARSSTTSAPKPQAAKPLMARDYICAMTLKSRNAATRVRRRGALRRPHEHELGQSSLLEMRLQLDDPPLVWILKFEVTRIV